ncbi:hypothetical protein [Paraburkholderia caribensis]|uniref:hypothetical protein n=1 Tax=Paraburkholderia caribensis TaxID=75105 RepID=UPI0015922D57|nr:hypothetical protein [Paraburkholderia caribensis]
MSDTQNNDNVVTYNVSFGDCRDELLTRAGPNGTHAYEQWRKRRGYGAVAEFVEGFTHSHLFCVSSTQVREVLQRSNHALGAVHKSEQLPIIENFTTPFAFQHLFHWYIETHNQLPTWDEYKEWMKTGEAARHWYDPLRKHLLGNGYRGFSKKRLASAIRWRLGKVYYSNMREIELLARLRASGVPVKYHLLADVLLRVDFWSGRRLACTYVPNEKYRDKNLGRKRQTVEFFEGAKQPMVVEDFPIERQGAGRIWWASDDTVKRIGSFLSAQ